MDAKLMTVALSLLLAAATYALPAGDPMEDDGLSADKRPKYMDTRDLDLFKFMLLSSIRDLVEEGKLNPAVLPAGEANSDDAGAVMKRMQYMGICMRRRNNSFIPYPCIRTGRR